MMVYSLTGDELHYATTTNQTYTFKGLRLR